MVADANGIDSAVQKFLFGKNYNKVVVFASNGRARNNIGSWQVEKVQVDGKVKGFDLYIAKDIQMAKMADCGFMIWNGESRGTLKAILLLHAD